MNTTWLWLCFNNVVTTLSFKTTLQIKGTRMFLVARSLLSNSTFRFILISLESRHCLCCRCSQSMRQTIRPNKLVVEKEKNSNYLRRLRSNICQRTRQFKMNLCCINKLNKKMNNFKAVMQHFTNKAAALRQTLIAALMGSCRMLRNCLKICFVHFLWKTIRPGFLSSVSWLAVSFLC